MITRAIPYWTGFASGQMGPSLGRTGSQDCLGRGGQPAQLSQVPAQCNRNRCGDRITAPNAASPPAFTGTGPPRPRG